MHKLPWLFSILIVLGFTACKTRAQGSATVAHDNKIITGAERMELYLPMLQGKRIGIFANHTSIVGTTNLVDTLVKRGVQIKIIFGPEHGFRGTADAGEKVGNYTDERTGIPVVSLY